MDDVLIFIVDHSSSGGNQAVLIIKTDILIRVLESVVAIIATL